LTIPDLERTVTGRPVAETGSRGATVQRPVIGGKVVLINERTIQVAWEVEGKRGKNNEPDAEGGDILHNA
jgi:hypothetical protein